MIVHALARLIQQRRREDPTLTFTRISELSEGAVSSSVAQYLGSSGQLAKFPEPRTIIGLAKALDIPESKVLLAAAESVGINVDDIAATSSLHGLQADLAALPEELRQEISDLVQVTAKHLHAG